MKPKQNKAGSVEKVNNYDSCQTPRYAVSPLIPHLLKFGIIWEPASGEGMLAEAICRKSHKDVIESDLVTTGHNFFTSSPGFDSTWDCIVTNPPYSIKPQWLARCYQLGKPFALLVPVEFISTVGALVYMLHYGYEIMLLSDRVNFKMPEKGFNGGGSQFPVLWLCWNILPEKIMIGDISQEKYEFERSLGKNRRKPKQLKDFTFPLTI